MDRERTLPAYTVIITGSRITRMGPADRIVIPAGALRIDGTGKYLIPGLVDTHVRWAGGQMG
jgi:imidazolonepropionase-like amidohydrolase